MQFFSLKNKRQHAGQKILQSEHGHKSSCVHTSFANYSPFSNHVSMIQSNKPGKIEKNHVTLTSYSFICTLLQQNSNYVLCSQCRQGDVLKEICLLFFSKKKWK